MVKENSNNCVQFSAKVKIFPLHLQMYLRTHKVLSNNLQKKKREKYFIVKQAKEPNLWSRDFWRQSPHYKSECPSRECTTRARKWYERLVNFSCPVESPRSRSTFATWNAERLARRRETETVGSNERARCPRGCDERRGAARVERWKERRTSDAYNRRGDKTPTRIPPW